MRSKFSAALALSAAALSVGGCTTPNPVPSTSPSLSTPSAPASASASASIARTAFTPAYAAATLDEYLKAIGDKNVPMICALNATTAPGNPNRQSMSDCFSNYQYDIKISSDYWVAGQLAKWTGMTGVASAAVVNEKNNFVFDSNRGGFKYAAGKPADCAAKSGCWFVVLYDSGRAYVRQGHDEVYYK